MPRSFEKSRLKQTEKLLQSCRVPSKVTSLAVGEFLASLDCPRSLAVWLMFRENEHDQLVQLECDPLNYLTAAEFSDAYCATSFLSKADFLKLSVDRRVVAMNKFLEFEDLCRHTNRRFSRLASDQTFTGPNVWLLNATKRKIAQILGDFDVSEMLDNANWGPGVTGSIKGSAATAVNKFRYETGITRDLYSLVASPEREKISLLAGYPRWFEHLSKLDRFPTFEVGSVTALVPKNAKTDRVISVEPGFNLWFQMGIGVTIRHRLRSWGIDLRYQDRNQYLASVSLKRELATVDFSSASDSISREVVRELLPSDWFFWMDATRSKYGCVKGSWLYWEKFSSMGNGFTFQLESLIFYAAALAVLEYNGLEHRSKDVSVYGDDVIVPSVMMQQFAAYSAFLGFKVNPEKSFSSGPFRESCGAHFWAGVDVKPIFLKKTLTRPETVYKLANAIRLYAHRRCVYLCCDARFRTAFELLVSSVPKTLRFRIPLGKNSVKRYGDGGFISNFDEARPSRQRFGIEGYRTQHATFTAVKQFDEGVGLLLTRLRGLSTSHTEKSDAELRTAELTAWARDSVTADGNQFPLRDVVRVRVRWLSAPTWYDLGPWF